MSFIDDIQTIAKTKDLEEKIAKAVKDAADLAKPSIDASRSMATQTGDGAVAVQSGPPGGNNPVVGITPTGSPVTAPPAAPTPPANAPGPVTTPTDGGSTLDTNSGTSRIGGGQATDLSGAATTAPSIGGSNIVDIATRLTNDPIYQQLDAQLAANGATDEERAKFRETYIAANYGEPGIKTAQDLADQDASAPQFNGSDPATPGDYQGKENLTGTIGFDKDGTISPTTGKPIVQKLQFGGPFPTPATRDLLPSHNPWTDADTPPVLPYYTAGSVWKFFNGGAPIFDQTFGGVIGKAQLTTVNDVVYGVDSPGGTGVITSINPSAPGEHLMFSSNPGGIIGQVSSTLSGTKYYIAYYPLLPLSTFYYGQFTCASQGSPAAATCALSTPHEAAWPLTGTNIFKLVGGKLTFSPYDSEILLGYTAVTSVLRMALGNGIDIIDDRFLEVTPGTRGGYVVSVLASDGVTVNSATYYNSDGVLTASIPSGMIKSYLPK